MDRQQNWSESRRKNFLISVDFTGRDKSISLPINTGKLNFAQLWTFSTSGPPLPSRQIKDFFFLPFTMKRNERSWQPFIIILDMTCFIWVAARWKHTGVAALVRNVPTLWYPRPLSIIGRHTGLGIPYGPITNARKTDVRKHTALGCKVLSPIVLHSSVNEQGTPPILSFNVCSWRGPRRSPSETDWWGTDRAAETW